MRKEFDKYYYYVNSVQSPEDDVVFLRDTFKKLTGRAPTTLTEDFCGTFAICCAWIQLSREMRAVGIDLSTEPLEWGKLHNLTELKPAQQERLQLINKDVLSSGLPKCDLIAAMNFSYYIFKSRNALVEYFKSCLDRLHKDGVLFADCFGGSDRGTDYEERVKHKGFTYYWHQKTFDPITNEARFSIHFKRDGEKKRQDVFTYDWRMWSIPEIREAMEEAGFAKTFVYWEGTGPDEEGNGEFSPAEHGEDCAGWIAYVVGLKEA